MHARPQHISQWFPCHVTNPGVALAAGAWIWGGTLDAIQQTITHGIRAGDPDARGSQMPRFGADGVLKPAEIQQVADYVMTLYGKGAAGVDVAAGKKLFAENCAVCHGDAGQGNRELGAPPLASRVHLNGDDRATVVAQITTLRMGASPSSRNLSPFVFTTIPSWWKIRRFRSVRARSAG